MMMIKGSLGLKGTTRGQKILRARPTQRLVKASFVLLGLVFLQRSKSVCSFGAVNQFRIRRGGVLSKDNIDSASKKPFDTPMEGLHAGLLTMAGDPGNHGGDIKGGRGGGGGGGGGDGNDGHLSPQAGFPVIPIPSNTTSPVGSSIEGSTNKGIAGGGGGGGGGWARGAWGAVRPHLALLLLAGAHLAHRARPHAPPVYIAVWALALARGGRGSGWLPGLGWAFAGLTALSLAINSRIDKIAPISATGSNYALVTGASSGIGRAIAGELGARGWNLVLVARRGERLRALAAALAKEHGVKTRTIVEDLASPDAAAAIYDQVKSKKLQVDVLVNNAGFVYIGELEDMPLETIDDMFNVNAVTPTKLMSLFGKEMAARGAGRVLSVGSIAGAHPLPSVDVYAGTKAYLAAVCQSAQYRLKRQGVGVTCALPGATRTEGFAREERRDPARAPMVFGLPGFVHTAERVAREAVGAMERADAVYVPGRLNSAYVHLFGLLVPRPLLMGFAERMWLPDPSGLFRAPPLPPPPPGADAEGPGAGGAPGAAAEGAAARAGADAAAGAGA